MKKIVFFVLMFLIVGCDDHKILSRADSGKTFTYTLGEEFTLELLENPTTGYVWHMKTHPEMVVSLVEDHFETPKTQRIGAGGKHVFVYRAVNSGKTEIQAFHARPWAFSKQNEPTLIYNIVVQ
ncbi:MAG: protease inhibitor I42 family protein [Alphaproteobacteria bacterium]|nr:protease inhibitor I42 family protein [Alphaproteobacteria bacterium]